jgi:hypothetical protein
MWPTLIQNISGACRVYPTGDDGMGALGFARYTLRLGRSPNATSSTRAPSAVRRGGLRRNLAPLSF